MKTKRPNTASSIKTNMGGEFSWILMLLILGLIFGVLALISLSSCSTPGTGYDDWPCPDTYCVSTTYPTDGPSYETIVCECRDPYEDEDGFEVITVCYDVEALSLIHI